jgi:hypothetical protein
MTDSRLQDTSFDELTNESCPAPRPNQCTWRHKWYRRFCGFNTGTVTDSCKYSDRIFSTTIDKNENVLAPLMDSFVPQP